MSSGAKSCIRSISDCGWHISTIVILMLVQGNMLATLIGILIICIYFHTLEKRTENVSMRKSNFINIGMLS